MVISQRLDIDSPADPFDVYRVLRTLNPSPYMYFMALTDAQGRDFNVIGSSPETLIKVDNGHAMTFPIAGSRPRGATPEEDETSRQGTAGRSEGTQRAHHARRPVPQRPEQGVPCRTASKSCS